MKKGDHLVSPRVAYQHHGLYIGDDMVIHYSGLSGSLEKGSVEMTSLENFAQGKGCCVQKHPICLYNVEERVERAFSKLGEDSYNIIWNNCEHFVNWCFNGVKHSDQVNEVASVTLAVSKKINERLAEEALHQVAKHTAKKTVEDAVLKSVVTSSAVSSTAGSAISAAAGATAGVAAASAITGAGAAAVGTVASVAAAGTLATIAAPIAVAAGVGYGVKKVYDWLFD